MKQVLLITLLFLCIIQFVVGDSSNVCFEHCCGTCCIKDKFPCCSIKNPTCCTIDGEKKCDENAPGAKKKNTLTFPSSDEAEELLSHSAFNEEEEYIEDDEDEEDDESNTLFVDTVRTNKGHVCVEDCMHYKALEENGLTSFGSRFCDCPGKSYKNPPLFLHGSYLFVPNQQKLQCLDLPHLRTININDRNRYYQQIEAKCEAVGCKCFKSNVAEVEKILAQRDAEMQNVGMEEIQQYRQEALEKLLENQEMKISTSTKSTCDGIFSSDSLKCYKAFEGKFVYSTAAMTCSSWGGYLATIATETENEIVSKLCSEQGLIGMSTVDGKWVWADGSTTTFNNLPEDTEETGVVSVSSTGEWVVSPAKSSFSCVVCNRY